MTPLQFAKAACDNFLPSGGCQGVRYSDDLSHATCSPRAVCLLAAADRCAHFEECILPQASWGKDSKEPSVKLQAKANMEAARSYKFLHPVVMSKS